MRSLELATKVGLFGVGAGFAGYGVSQVAPESLGPSYGGKVEKAYRSAIEKTFGLTFMACGLAAPTSLGMIVGTVPGTLLGALSNGFQGQATTKKRKGHHYQKAPQQGLHSDFNKKTMKLGNKRFVARAGIAALPLTIYLGLCILGGESEDEGGEEESK